MGLVIPHAEDLLIIGVPLIIAGYVMARKSIRLMSIIYDKKTGACYLFSHNKIKIF
jgi:hypothetical protein